MVDHRYCVLVYGSSTLLLIHLTDCLDTAVPLDESMFEIVSKGGLETVVAAMKRFPRNSLVQAAGCWLFGIVSSKNGKQSPLISLLLIQKNISQSNNSTGHAQRR